MTPHETASGTTPHRAALAKLENQLLEELDRYRDLLDVLLEQKALLTAHRVEELPVLLERQQFAVEAAKVLEPDRMQQLRTVAGLLGVEGSPTLRAVIDKLDGPERGRMTKIRESLLHVVPRVDQVNRINSLLIRNSMSFISATVRAILEESAPLPPTYERQGRVADPDRQPSITDRRV
jgi:hypothetical protein